MLHASRALPLTTSMSTAHQMRTPDTSTPRHLILTYPEGNRTRFPLALASVTTNTPRPATPTSSTSARSYSLATWSATASESKYTPQLQMETDANDEPDANARHPHCYPQSNQVLILKYAVGGSSLYKNWRPPSAAHRRPQVS